MAKAFQPSSAAARVAALADALESRARAQEPLLELFRAHLDAAAPGRARTAPEHLLELLEVGLRWRLHVPAVRRARAVKTGAEELAHLAALLAAHGGTETALARLRSWRDFALRENVREVMEVADELCTWFEQSASALGPGLSSPDDALELLRTEVACRAMRRRRTVFGGANAQRSRPT